MCYPSVTPLGVRGLETGATGGARTPDPRLRRPMLYPAELLSREWSARLRAAGTAQTGVDYTSFGMHRPCPITVPHRA
ncbi:hypothetical protein PSAC2689_90348 [Paraburkholderia sacchari]